MFIKAGELFKEYLIRETFECLNHLYMLVDGMISLLSLAIFSAWLKCNLFPSHVTSAQLNPAGYVFQFFKTFFKNPFPPSVFLSKWH